MTTRRLEEVERDIDNTLEISSICRSEWCRAVESDVDRLEGELLEMEPEIGYEDRGRFEELSHKLQAAYHNLGPDIHI